MRIWLSKPVYEMLPYFYIAAGAGCLIASLYLDYWYWPVVCLIAGIVCLIIGLMVFLRRRDFRLGKSPHRKDD